MFDIWGIGVGYWFCVSFFFSGRIFGGVIAVEEIWRLFVFARLLGPLSWMPIQIFIKSILSISCEFKKKTRSENNDSKYKKKYRKILQRYAISRNETSLKRVQVKNKRRRRGAKHSRHTSTGMVSVKRRANRR